MENSIDIEESVTIKLIVLGDFNAALVTVVQSELLEMCKSQQLVASDYAAFGQDSGQYIHVYVSDAHCTLYSFLDRPCVMQSRSSEKVRID